MRAASAPSKTIALSGIKNGIAKPAAMDSQKPLQKPSIKGLPCVRCGEHRPSMTINMKLRGPVCSQCKTSSPSSAVAPAPQSASVIQPEKPALTPVDTSALVDINASTPAILASGRISEASDAGEPRLADQILEKYAEEKKAAAVAVPAPAPAVAVPAPEKTHSPVVREASPSPPPAPVNKPSAPVAPTTAAISKPAYAPPRRPSDKDDILANILYDSEGDYDYPPACEEEKEQPKIVPVVVDKPQNEEHRNDKALEDTTEKNVEPARETAEKTRLDKEKSTVMTDKERAQLRTQRFSNSGNASVPVQKPQQPQPQPPKQQPLPKQQPQQRRTPPQRDTPTTRRAAQSSRRSRSPSRSPPPRRARSPLQHSRSRSPSRWSRSPPSRRSRTPSPRRSRSPPSQGRWAEYQQRAMTKRQREMERDNASYLQRLEDELRARFDASRQELLAWRDGEFAAIEAERRHLAEERANADAHRKSMAELKRRREDELADLNTKIDRARQEAESAHHDEMMRLVQARTELEHEQFRMDELRKDIYDRQRQLDEQRAKFESDVKAANEKLRQAEEREREALKISQEAARIKDFAARQLDGAVKECENVEVERASFENEKKAFEEERKKQVEAFEALKKKEREELEAVQARVRSALEQRQADLANEKARLQKECDEVVRVSKEQIAAALAAFNKVIEAPAPALSNATVDTVTFETLVREARFAEFGPVAKRSRVQPPVVVSAGGSSSSSDAAAAPLPPVPAAVASPAAAYATGSPDALIPLSAPPTASVSAQLTGAVSNTIAVNNETPASIYDLPLTPIQQQLPNEVIDRQNSESSLEHVDALIETQAQNYEKGGWSFDAPHDFDPSSITSFDPLDDSLFIDLQLDQMDQWIDPNSVQFNLPPTFNRAGPPPPSTINPMLLSIQQPSIPSEAPTRQQNASVNTNLVASYNQFRPIAPAPSVAAPHGFSTPASFYQEQQQQQPAPQKRTRQGRPRQLPQGTIVFVPGFPKGANKGLNAGMANGLSQPNTITTQPKYVIPDIPKQQYHQKRGAPKQTAASVQSVPTRRLQVLREEYELSQRIQEPLSNNLEEEYRELMAVIDAPSHPSLVAAEAGVALPAPLMPQESVNMNKEIVQRKGRVPVQVFYAFNGIDPKNQRRFARQEKKRALLKITRRQQQEALRTQQNQQSVAYEHEDEDQEEIFEDTTSASAAPEPIHEYPPLTVAALEAFDLQHQYEEEKQQVIHACDLDRNATSDNEAGVVFLNKIMKS